jgi:lipopolysaccharide export system permease protein
MRLLDRYLLRELLVPLGFCLMGLLIIGIASDVFVQLDDLLGAGLRPREIIEFYLVRSPQFVVFLLPIALLLALLWALTSLARHHEIVAMRAAGLSIWRLALPFFAVGAVCGGALFVLNEYLVPDGLNRAEQIKTRGAKETHLKRNFGFANARDGRSWHMSVFNQLTSEMTQPQVIWTQPDGARWWLSAERAVPTNGAWLFFNVREYREAPASGAAPVPVSVTNVLFMPQFSETPEIINSEIKMSARLGGPFTREADMPLFEILSYLRLHPDLSPTYGNQIYAKMHGRLAAPFTCVIVVLIALPFGAASGRRNVFVGVAGSIFICFAYFVLQQVGLAVAAGGHVPAWLGGWLPNLTFGAIGLWLTARVR